MYPCNAAVLYLPRSQQRSHRREPLRHRPGFRMTRAATQRHVLCPTSEASLQCFRTTTTPTVNSRSSKSPLVTVHAAFYSQHQTSRAHLPYPEDTIKPPIFVLLHSIDVSLQCFRTLTTVTIDSESMEGSNYDIDPMIERTLRWPWRAGAGWKSNRSRCTRKPCRECGASGGGA